MFKGKTGVTLHAATGKEQRESGEERRAKGKEQSAKGEEQGVEENGKSKGRIKGAPHTAPGILPFALMRQPFGAMNTSRACTL